MTLALMDKACIVDLNGKLIAYASMIKNVKNKESEEFSFDLSFDIANCYNRIKPA